MPDVRWWSSSAVADQALADHARWLLGEAEIAVGRLCPRCGSSGHGRPWLRHATAEVAVSLSRTGPHLVTALVADPGGSAVGVDVEATGDHDPESWVRAEAVLKALGTGLGHPDPAAAVAAFHGTLAELRAPLGYVAAIALLPPSGHSSISRASNRIVDDGSAGSPPSLMSPIDVAGGLLG